MCDGLSQLEAALRRYAADFDAGLLTVEQASVAVRLAARIEKMAVTVRGLAAARMAHGGESGGSGDRSVTAELARVTGGSVGAAAEALKVTRSLAGLPIVEAAARRGDLSAAQAAAIVGAATADPAAESGLVALAGRSSLAELREECARVRAAATDPEERRVAIHASRYLRSYTDAEGAWNLRVRDNPEVGAQIMAALEPLRDRLFQKARAEGRREPPEAYGADALAALARGEGREAKRGRAKVIVRVDLRALLRGYPTSGEVCEVAGFGPVAPSAVRDMVDSGDPFLAAVVTRGEAVVGVAHLGRRATAAQQTALEWLYPTCAAEGCGAVARLETDHRVDWAATHLTVFELLDRLCPHHHRLKTREGWGLVEGRGKRAFVPPDDARHPRQARAHGPPRAAA